MGSPTVVTVTAPTGQVASPAATDRVLTAAAASIPGARVVDQQNTGDAHFATADGRTGFGLVYTPEQNGLRDSITPTITAAAAAAAPAAWHTGVTGLGQLQAGGSG